jgi:hypothetical protein
LLQRTGRGAVLLVQPAEAELFAAAKQKQLLPIAGRTPVY